MPKARLAPVTHARPFSTYYYEPVRAVGKDWTRIGHASTIRGAVRAAVGHILDRRYSSCVIHDLDKGGLVVAKIFRRGKDIVVIGVFLE